ncbi:zinc finger, c2h2 type domain-containing protein [Cardiosporidium cionae]|uniref:Zinc finger, c2h2 type domain-containing protein n=1 Tax=Cardiosporidium cionae TaxID=476202 RepID=A0ABQ7JG75_9APIC|nr:zinc finger, c2h2 type domain-containing protein [Cardiosporidium cionae]|eukprot:KAF8822988.1 zinc finger, c2h2 type domain-containing protein [Cardiosporidium cionae]
MGRKKRRGLDLKPFCYYCEREFDEDKILIQHQKAKHFKCSECSRKLDTATGLVVHLLQVHKETRTKVPNALSGRDDPGVIIHGMNGVPQSLILEKQEKLKENSGLKDAKKKQRVQWAQVSMAPSFDKYIQSPQGLQRPFPMLPTGMPNMPFPPMSMMMGMSNGAFQMPPVQFPNTSSSPSAAFSNGPQISPSPMMASTATRSPPTTTRQFSSALTGGLPIPTVGGLAPPGISPPPPPRPPPASLPSFVPTTTVGPQGATVAALAEEMAIPGSRPPPGGGMFPLESPFLPQGGATARGISAFPPSTTVGAAQAKPLNLKLFYEEDLLSLEEKRAMREWGYQPKQENAAEAFFPQPMTTMSMA